MAVICAGYGLIKISCQTVCLSAFLLLAPWKKELEELQGPSQETKEAEARRQLSMGQALEARAGNGSEATRQASKEVHTTIQDQGK